MRRAGSRRRGGIRGVGVGKACVLCCDMVLGNGFESKMSHCRAYLIK